MLTPKIIAARMQVTTQTVVNWHLRGVRLKKKRRTVIVRLSAGKLGGRWVITASALSAFLDQLGYPLPTQQVDPESLPHISKPP